MRLTQDSAQSSIAVEEDSTAIDIRRELVSHAHDRREQIAQLWLSLGEDGPTYGDVGSAPHEIAEVLDGYLRPLARLLADALAAAGTLRTVYLDERTRFFPQGLSAEQRRALVADHLEVEIDALAALLAGATEGVRAAEILRELHAPLLRPSSPADPRLLLIGDCLMADTRLFLGSMFEQRTALGLDIDHISFNAGWRTLEPQDIARRSAVVPPALIGLSLFTYEGIPAYKALLGDAGRLRGARLRGRVEECVAILAATVEAIREVTDAPLLIHSVCGMPIGPRRIRYRFVPAEWPGRRRLIREMTRQIAALVDATENAMLIDEDVLIRRAGGLRRVAGQLLAPEYLGAWFHPSRFGPVLAEEYADVLDSVALLGKAKVLLVDLDNTLWQGVMAEGDVVHDHEGQRLLKQLREAGVLLVALSKNDPASIRWDELELAPEDFVLHKIDWRPKPEGVSEAIRELDLAAEAFVLLDDNPVERALVEENVPGVHTLDSTDPFAWRSLRRWLELPSTKLTEEARARTQMYREAASRRSAMGAEHDYEKMMGSLDLRAEIRLAERSELDRLVELIQRTNQFNTTTRRRSVAEIRGLLESDRHELHVASLADRFGDLGIVAIAIVELHEDSASAEIDSFVMSCRAMGFGLEQLLLHQLTAGRAELTWTAAFRATERNGPAASLYPNGGFESADGELWTLAPQQARPPRPAWFA